MAEDMLPGSGFILNEDGSLDRIGEVPEDVRQEAKEKGYTIKPDHIPAEDADKWFPGLVKDEPVEQPVETVEQSEEPAADKVRRYPRWDRKRT